MSAFLLTFDPSKAKLSNHKLPIHPLVDGSEDGNMPGAPACAGFVPLKAGASALTHLHEDSWTYIVVLSTGPDGVITQLGTNMEFYVVQRPGQLLVIKPGLPHRVRNTSKDWVTAIELRTCGSVFDDRVLLPALDDVDLDAAEEVAATATGLVIPDVVPPMPTIAELDAGVLGTGRFR